MERIVWIVAGVFMFFAAVSVAMQFRVVAEAVWASL
jgi:hypothetical protein